MPGTSAQNNPEIGEELLASQLEPGTVVVLIGTHRPGHALTAWVDSVSPVVATFFVGDLRMVLALRVNAQGQMFDDLNHRIAAHRYLGDIQARDRVPMRVMVRGFKAGTLLWSQLLVFAEFDIERFVPALAEEHAAACASGELGMIEMEFLDEPDPRDRFFRIGVEPEGMVMPFRVELKEPPQ